MGSGKLAWSASYITPKSEWRHIAEVHSYIYSISDPAARDKQVRQAESDKQWIDAQSFVFEGQKVVAVIRPPRTVQPNGTAAFGIGTGLVQENGQIRFTFAEGYARKLAAFMIAQRKGNARAREVIHSEPYIFQGVSGAYTVKGVCDG